MLSRTRQHDLKVDYAFNWLQWDGTISVRLKSDIKKLGIKDVENLTIVTTTILMKTRTLM